MSIYDFETMQNLDNSCREDLFGVVSRSDPLIVDNCAEWKNLSLEKPNRAFILGRTVSSEADNLEGVFFNREIIGGRLNVFLLALHRVNHVTVIAIHRLDRGFKSCFAGPLPTLGKMLPDERAQWNDPGKRRMLRDKVLEMVRIFPTELLLAKIKECAPLAFKNYRLSCCVAEWAYALMLQEAASKDKEECQKVTSNHENLFGDTNLVQEAMFFKAGILSKNAQHIRPMTSYCGIKFERQPQQKAVKPSIAGWHN